MAKNIENFPVGTIINIGDMFGYLKVIDIKSEITNKIVNFYILKCECGSYVKYTKFDLRKKVNLSCGGINCQYNPSNFVIINNCEFKMIIGETIGNLKIIDKYHNTSSHQILMVQCLCGSENFEINKYQLKTRKFFDCGLLNCKYVLNNQRFQNNTLYILWVNIKQRCFNTADNYKYFNWGGRGITMYEPWINNFQLFKEYIDNLSPNKEEFILANPNQMISLDRIDNNGNYEPGNLRWATNQEQLQNTKFTKFTESDIKYIRECNMPVIDIAKKYSCSLSAIYRILNGSTWSNII